MKQILVLLALVLLVISSDDLTAKRAGKNDSVIKLTSIGDLKLVGTNGSSISVNDDEGFGIEFGNHISDHLYAGLEVSYNRAGYTANYVFEDQNAALNNIEVINKLDSIATLFVADYYLSTNRFTPYFGVSLGWTYLDTNIPTGEVDDVCWYDPWVGYYCGERARTHSAYEFTYQARAGIRYDFNHSFIKFSYSNHWLDLDNLGTVDTDRFTLEFGARY